MACRNIDRRHALLAQQGIEATDSFAQAAHQIAHGGGSVSHLLGSRRAALGK